MQPASTGWYTFAPDFVTGTPSCSLQHNGPAGNDSAGRSTGLFACPAPGGRTCFYLWHRTDSARLTTIGQWSLGKSATGLINDLRSSRVRIPDMEHASPSGYLTGPGVAAKRKPGRCPGQLRTGTSRIMRVNDGPGDDGTKHRYDPNQQSPIPRDSYLISLVFRSPQSTLRGYDGTCYLYRSLTSGLSPILFFHSSPLFLWDNPCREYGGVPVCNGASLKNPSRIFLGDDTGSKRRDRIRDVLIYDDLRELIWTCMILRTGNGRKSAPA
jgi:hypothetical protein